MHRPELTRVRPGVVPRERFRIRARRGGRRNLDREVRRQRHAGWRPQVRTIFSYGCPSSSISFDTLIVKKLCSACLASLGCAHADALVADGTSSRLSEGATYLLFASYGSSCHTFATKDVGSRFGALSDTHASIGTPKHLPRTPRDSRTRTCRSSPADSNLRPET